MIKNEVNREHNISGGGTIRECIEQYLPFRIALAMEKEKSKPFCKSLDKSDRKKFGEMFDIPRFYISACSNSVQYVRLPPPL
jgi:hypothetical protein